MKQDMTIIWLDTVDSTQDEVHRRMETLANLSVVAARSQTSGRGQRGNRWETRPGENLTFSLLLRPGRDGVRAIPAEDQFLLSEMATLAMHQTLAGYGIDTRIKWPNDIYAGDKKLCGMLIENSLMGGQVVSSIIGIGLNVNQTDFNPELMNPVSLSKLTGRSYSVPEVLDRFLDAFRHCLEEDRNEIRSRFLQPLYRLEERHAFTDCRSGEVFEGTIKGISERGLLRVKMPDGNIREFGFKGISYII
ncbi:MAG: biotin--[Bacteroidales bacterium]|nr:biotin--[acetyl-CoA-carboxylase] ligase [Bacteroidales bacterium]